VRVDAERNNADATRALEEADRALPEVIAWPLHQPARTFGCTWWPRSGRLLALVDADAVQAADVKDLHTSFSLAR